MDQTPKVLRLPTRKPPKRARGRSADPAQLGLFKPRISRLSTGRAPYDEALWLDEAKHAGAQEAYRRAIEAGDRVADAWCNLGILAGDDGDRAFARACFTQALVHEPAHFEAHYNLGHLYDEEEGTLHPALVHYRIAASLRDDPDVHYNTALALMKLRDFRGAVSSLEEFCGMALSPSQEAISLLDELKEDLSA